MNERAPGWILLLCMPLLALGADAARREFMQVVALEPDDAAGREAFAPCAACHGENGAGNRDGSVPRIAGQHYRVLVQQIIDFRQGRRWDVRMEGAARSHESISGPQDVANVAWFASRLADDGSRGVGDGQDIERGADIYETWCRSCHGEHAAGDGKRGIPRLAGQHAAYLARQIHDAVDGRRPALTASHRGRLADLDFQDVRGLTDYLARIGWQPGQ